MSGGFTWVQGRKRKTYNEKQGERLTRKMAQKDAKLIPNANAGRGRPKRHLQHPESDWQDFDDELNMGNSILDEDPIQMLRKRPQRDEMQRRKNAANSWVKMEDNISNIMGQKGIMEVCICVGSTQTPARPRRFVSFEKYEVRQVSLCSCGYSLQEIIKEGFFPSTPKAPETFFCTHLLRALVEMTNLGSISRTAFAEGLRLALSRRYNVELPSFARLLRDSHHHFMAATVKFENQIDQVLTLKNNLTYLRTAYRNTCPACFNFGVQNDPCTVFISVDGNMQHTRFSKGKTQDFEVFPLRGLMNYGFRDYPLAEDAPIDNIASCGNSFKALKEWNSAPKLSSETKRALDETGLMGSCCIHGTFLRVLNFYKSLERRSHAAAIIKDMFADEDIGAQITHAHVCYDVGCKFDKGKDQPGVFEPSESARISSRINRFHLFGHQYSCHILYNLLRTPDWGLMNGEEIERLWASIRHLIRAGRVCSGPRRSQRIDAAVLNMARLTRENMGANIARRVKNAHIVNEKQTDILEKIIGAKHPGLESSEILIDEEYLIEQEGLQRAFYLKETLSAKERAAILRRNEVGRDIRTRKVRVAQRRVVHILVNSSVELAEVERCTRGMRNAEDFMRALRGRGKKLDGAVERFNREVRALPPGYQGRTRLLDVKLLRQEGLNHDALWDVDRSKVAQDWARFPQVRLGIEAMHRKKRAAEEVMRCSLQLARHCKWIIETAAGIMAYMADANELAQDEGRELKSLLRHRKTSAENILKQKDLVSGALRNELKGAIREISQLVPTDPVFVASHDEETEVGPLAKEDSGDEDAFEDLFAGMMSLNQDSDDDDEGDGDVDNSVDDERRDEGEMDDMEMELL